MSHHYREIFYMVSNVNFFSYKHLCVFNFVFFHVNCALKEIIESTLVIFMRLSIVYGVHQNIMAGRVNGFLTR